MNIRIYISFDLFLSMLRFVTNFVKSRCLFEVCVFYEITKKTEQYCINLPFHWIVSVAHDLESNVIMLIENDAFQKVIGPIDNGLILLSYDIHILCRRNHVPACTELHM